MAFFKSADMKLCTDAMMCLSKAHIIFFVLDSRRDVTALHHLVLIAMPQLDYDLQDNTKEHWQKTRF